MTKPSNGNGAVVKERVRQLEDRVGEVEKDLKGFFQSYNDERTANALWRGQVATKLDEVKADLVELKNKNKQQKKDRATIIVAFIMSSSALIATALNLIFR